MRISFRRWWHPALLLLLVILVASCRETPATVEESSPEPVRAVPTTQSTPSPKAETATPMPMVSFMGVEFAYDEQLLGPLGTAARLHAEAPGALPAQPERIEIKLSASSDGRSPVMYVFPVAQYEAISPEAAREIAALRDLLDTRPSSIQGGLPLLPMHQAIESYHSRPTYVGFRNGAGVSYLAQADHDHSLSTEETFFYTFQGLTDDDQFYVATFIPLLGTSATTSNEESTADATDSSAQHNAKPAIAASWIGVDMGDGLSLVDDIMSSLLIRPEDGFPEIALPDYVTHQGVMLGYDSDLSGETAVERVPAVVEDHNGSREFLPEVPDILLVSFAHDQLPEDSQVMEIQAIRDDQDAFFGTIPTWQQDEVATLESTAPATLAQQIAGNDLTQVQPIEFQNGHGLRWTEVAGSAPGAAEAATSTSQVYRFSGVTDDGHYLIRFRHPLPATLSEADALAYLDSVVSSTMVAADASTGSSVPMNPVDCENNAEFVTDVSIPDNTVVERGQTFVKIWRVRNTGTCAWTPAYGLSFAQGNPADWQGITITDVVTPGGEIEVGVSVLSPESPGVYQSWWQLSDSTGQPFGDLLSLLFESPRPATDIPGYGVIEGEISYPANGNPAVDIYFMRTDGSERFAMQTERGWTRFSNAVPVGSYYVFGRVAGDSSDSGGGYTEAVICGLHAGCDNHSLVEVVVEEGVATRNVNIFDWYAPAGTFPLPELAQAPIEETPLTPEATPESG